MHLFKPDNGSDHRVRTIIYPFQSTRKPDFACITLLFGEIGFNCPSPFVCARHDLTISLHYIVSEFNNQWIWPLFQWLDSNIQIGGLLVHCGAGMSRSPAIALLALCHIHPESDALENMRYVASRSAAKYIWPNVVFGWSVIPFSSLPITKNHAELRGSSN